MHRRSRRPSTRARPALERVEERQPPSAGLSKALIAQVHQRPAPVRGLTAERITNPTPFNTRLVPPFRQVQVQTLTPVPGQVYNVVFISLRNSTRRTFDAGSGLAAKVTGQTSGHAYPIVTGTDVWRPGEVIILYFFTKKYYPLRPVESAGFEFNFTNPRVVAIPGPSGFFQRIRYNPATFARVLDSIVITGPGSRGRNLGLPDTSLWEVIPSRAAGVPL